jgi:hypothetical protein
MTEDQIMDHLELITQGLHGLPRLRAAWEVLAWADAELKAALPEARAQGASWEAISRALEGQQSL